MDMLKMYQELLKNAAWTSLAFIDMSGQLFLAWLEERATFANSRHESNATTLLSQQLSVTATVPDSELHLYSFEQKEPAGFTLSIHYI